MKRIVEFADKNNLSKYNPAERCWGDYGKLLERDAVKHISNHLGMGENDSVVIPFLKSLSSNSGTGSALTPKISAARFGFKPTLFQCVW